MIEVKSLKAAPWDTQIAIAVVPATYYIVSKEGRVKIRTGVTIATMRVLPKVIRCYRCHEMGHTISNCGNDPKCTLCSRGSEVRTNHVMGSLACPTLRKLIQKETVRGRAP